ncbi:Mut7-C ubiquitin/RNAse domain-containing protein [Halopseudomonas nanhaiensis]|uniref:Mut7-C ubiquitin/RNAse domain-containing protein n=1 Tax=Halopseudomonas nanhaiensis TaxID=2830842 RepID=UPI001CBEFD04|nr:Mut7-C ubiquitin/RNAse domain-containing protein [Halopseudomonas nanhaiensis]UAW97249.1 Mut7-C ubiquitin/RNAse domain-containing protein [Halopseudomonas nanhaiensis]
MTTAIFCFNARLNRFLAMEHRAHAFSRRCARHASVKHMVEALGVPHTEVGLVVVNGAASTLDAAIGDGDRIDVFPWGPACLAPNSNDPYAGTPRFVADSHLGALARLLRMTGFDTLYDNCYDDAELAALACREHRIVLTRDRELLKRRVVRLGCHVDAIEPREQLVEVHRRFDLRGRMRPLSRCLGCNVTFRRVDKRDVLDRLPERVIARHDAFFVCDACERIFWEGTHWVNMRQLIDRLVGSAHEK